MRQVLTNGKGHGDPYATHATFTGKLYVSKLVSSMYII